MTSKPIIKYGILVICVIIWYVVVWSGLNDLLSQNAADQEKLSIKLQNLHKETQKLADADKRLKKAQAEFEALKARLMQGENSQVVGNLLQDQLFKFCSDNKIEVLSYKTERPGKWQDKETPTVNFTLKTQLPELLKLISYIENHNQHLWRIRQLYIVSMRGNDPHLRVTLGVETLFWP